MKKFYSIVAAVIFAATVNAQGTETFSTQTALTTSYADGTFAGETTGVTVNYVHSRNEGLGTSDDYAISGKGIMLRRSDEPSSVEFVIPNGVGSFTFKYRKAFTGGTNNRQLAVFVDGTQVDTTPMFGAAGADATVYTLTTAISKPGTVRVKISYPAGTATGNKQVTVDDVSWTAYSSMAVGDASASKASLVKNTVVANNIMFNAKADVQIVNMNGQVVKSASVNENTSLDVASLPKGTYVVTGVVNGKSASQKIIKK